VPGVTAEPVQAGMKFWRGRTARTTGPKNATFCQRRDKARHGGFGCRKHNLTPTSPHALYLDQISTPQHRAHLHTSIHLLCSSPRQGRGRDLREWAPDFGSSPPGPSLARPLTRPRSNIQLLTNTHARGTLLVSGLSWVRIPLFRPWNLGGANGRSRRCPISDLDLPRA
jgi:hypothetical protein